ncbi:MAG TPA: dihydroorotate dehydrogenase [Eubacteriales bacterium]|nr:dihydroorotate dehydrogenase [Eubacteriales bacterium]
MQSDPLAIDLLGVPLKNPVIAASGTFGFGREYAALFDVSRLGGISGKGLTLFGSPGNDGARICETPAGMLNSIGLENPGVRKFAEEEAPFLRSLGPAVLCNLGGHSEEEYIEGARQLNAADFDFLELNISCPNVKNGGMAFGMTPESAADITKKVKAVTNRPLIVKLSPNAPELVAVARACESAGADALSLVNTFLGMAVDVRAKRAVFDNVYAGLSGPAILPIALRMTHQVCRAVQISVIGMGGISSAEDALRFIMVGASAVQVGCATFAHPAAMLDIIDGLSDYCKTENLGSIHDVCGII